MLIQTLNQNTITVEATELAASNKKSTIHVLHVDDDPSIQEITKLMLLDLDSSIEIDNSCCVDEALTKLASKNYDVVVSDYEMPQKKDGLEFLKELREQHNKIPFILFTGKGREEVAIQALNLGADGYFNKQGSPETVYGELCYGIIQTVCHKQAEDDLRKNEIALKNSEEQYRVYTENSPVAFFVVNPEGKYTQVNDAATKLLLYSKNELLKMSILDILFEKDISSGLKQFAVLKETGKSRFETALKRKDGEPVYVILNATQLPDGNMMAFCEDITEHKRLNEALKQSEERLKLLFENAPDAYYLNDFKGNFLDGNKAAEEMIGYSRNELIGNSFLSLNVLPRNQIPKAAKLLALNAIGRSTGPDEFILNRKDGTQISVEIRTHPLKIQGKKLVLGIARDISERRATEEKLHETQEKYENTFESSMDALMLLDEKGFFECNKTTLLLFGCKSVNEFTKFHPADLSPPTQPDGTSSMIAAMSHIQRAFQTGTDHFFWIHKRTDGTTFSADVLLTRMPLKGREVLQATVRDITEQKKAEEAIKFQADLLNHVGQAILMVDNNKTIRFWNKAAENLYGYSEEQALGHQVTEILGGTSPEEAEEVSKRLMAGESWSTEVYTKNRDGSVVPIILNRTPLYKENGEFLGAASISTDISLQKNTEADLTFSLKSLSNSLDRIQELNEKLRVVGSLTRHDVRNKLSAVTGYAYILKKKHTDLPDIVDGLSKMEQAVAETVKIFDFAKMYEQIGAEELTYVNVEEKLNESVALFSGPIPTIKSECHGLTVLADSFLGQLFYNFIDNTRKYGQKTTTIRLNYENGDQDSLNLVYEDDGVGVSLENKPRLFKEGFSTGGSTGFGLFLTKKMIDVYGWTIEENGEPGRGAKFTIIIPKLNKNAKENYQIIP